jgi:hypothetical protein
MAVLSVSTVALVTSCVNEVLFVIVDVIDVLASVVDWLEFVVVAVVGSDVEILKSCRIKASTLGCIRSSFLSVTVHQ